MYIFVIILTPTTESPDAHFGIVIIGDDVDMLVCAWPGCMLTKSMLMAISRVAVVVFIDSPWSIGMRSQSAPHTHNAGKLYLDDSGPLDPAIRRFMSRSRGGSEEAPFFGIRGVLSRRRSLVVVSKLPYLPRPAPLALKAAV